MSLKRAVDLVLVIGLAPLWLPGAALVGLLAWSFQGRPVWFRQQRPGRDGRLFTLYKFRTMTQARDGSGQLLPDAHRLTRFGRWLRRTSLDELPELLNVLKGDMSLVGPRPLLPEYLGRYSAEQRRRHEVLPGLTGWAQVHGRNALSWDEKLALDVWYVDHRNFWLDCRILARTGWQVLAGRGVTAHGSATMPAFQGSAPARPLKQGAQEQPAS